jgi:drug/metabolite transporter (DMT)-like permease
MNTQGDPSVLGPGGSEIPLSRTVDRTIVVLEPTGGLSNATKGVLIMIFGAAILSTMNAVVRDLGQDLHPFEIAFFRNLFGGVALLPFIVYRGAAQLRSRQPRLLALRGVIGAISMLAWFYGLATVPIAEATALSFVGIVFASLGAVVFLGEVMRIRRSMAVAVSFVGALVMLRPGFAEISLGAIMVVFSAAMWGLGVLAVKALSRTDSPVCIVAWTSVSITLLTAVPAFLVWEWPDSPQFGLLLLIGIMASAGHDRTVRVRRNPRYLDRGGRASDRRQRRLHLGPGGKTGPAQAATHNMM